jgi:hypothetical protein
MCKLLVLSIFVISSITAFSQPYAGDAKIKLPEIPTKAAGCIPPTGTTTMDLNNVRFLVHTAGNMWQVPTKNLSVYEVPKNSGIMALFTSALWLGGTDVNNQLKLAALRYRSGQDYWTGPLSQGDAETNADNCFKYDKHFISQQDEVREFASWYKAGQDDLSDGTNTQSTLFPNYQVPRIIKEWPAHGDVSQGQDYYLAPFYDNNDDGTYNWEDGDYPYHDIYKTRDCNTDRKVLLYGDLNYWWVMNDKGNIHTETGADPIGMEIRGQAFCFASNDEINNMSFYNYELINRGSLTLFNTYFGFFTDGALGDPYDDFVGCDVNRGLAYYYNGNNFDADNAGFKGYGDTPPAVGVDFFEGPYQDNDGIDNAFGIGPGEALNGIGYGDGIVDNERFGMRRFLYYSNTTNGSDPSQTDPINSADYYNYLKGFWKDGSPFYYGGSGHLSDPDADQLTPCEFMFPGDTDPLGWGTGGVPQAPWTEQTAGNTPNDRRFVQSAGPFILKPGSVNNITVGVVWARASGGSPFASVEVLRRADDKAQSLFENCFKLIDAPHAPELKIQELNNEVILFLSNPINSNNYNEAYEERDPFIVGDSTVDKKYRFQGYQIYQLASNAVSPSDLQNISKARLVAQCDIKDNIARLINFEFDQVLQASRPMEMVNGENKGIRHSFQVKEDLFSQGDRRLVNFKRYYYMAVAYAYNNFKTYDPTNPTALDGQKTPYLQSRKSYSGDVKVIEAIPHNPMPEAGGTYSFIAYGSSPEIRRMDGHGNGYRSLELTSSSELSIVRNGYDPMPVYKEGKGPLAVKVIDPLNLAPGYFECKFRDFVPDAENSADTASWIIYRYDKEDGEIIDSIVSGRTIALDNEQLIPQWGVSVQIVNLPYTTGAIGVGAINEENTEYISSKISFSDSSKQWLDFIADMDNFTPRNWIRSGTFRADPVIDPWNISAGPYNPQCYKDEAIDDDKKWTKVMNGGWAPHQLVGYQCDFMPLAYHKSSLTYPNNPEAPTNSRAGAGLSMSPSFDVVITSDKSKWTRCPVIELGRDPNLNIGGAKPGDFRKSQSVNKNGVADGTGIGMGWFPGYAIDVESGARLYMAFGENSFLSNDNGSDMKWNPSSRMNDGLGSPVLGGQHPIYVFSYKQKQITGFTGTYDLGAYSESNNELQSLLTQVEANNGLAARQFYTSLTWVGNTIAKPFQQLMSTDVRMSIRVNKEFKNFTATGKNNGKPMYSWNMDKLATSTQNGKALAEALMLINVVPNPYYAYSDYERNRLDNRVKIINLPEKCDIRIYTIHGKLVKSISKTSPLTYQDWTLTNHANIPVASGIYLIHVHVPDVGDRVLKLFAGVRSVDFYSI